MSIFGCCYRSSVRQWDQSTSAKSEMVVRPSTKPTPIDVSKEELMELERPSEINMQLEVNINMWEIAISQFDELENFYVDGKDANVLPVLKSLKENPDGFLQSPHESVRKLAEKRKEMMALEQRVGVKRKSYVSINKLPSNITRTVSTAENSDKSTSMLGSSALNPIQEAEERESISKLQRRISVSWTNRMQMIDDSLAPLDLDQTLSGRTHSERRIAPSPQVTGSQLRRIRPKWPDYLADVSFEVLKVNSIGKKLRRTMKLTEYHIVNIKVESSQVSKVHKYTEISQIWLDSTNVLKIKLKDALVLTYISPIASHIIQQISTRVKTRLALDKTVFSDPVINFGDMPQSIDHLFSAINEDNAINSTSSIQSFAAELASSYTSRGSNSASRPMNNAQSLSSTNSRPVSFGVEMAVDEDSKIAHVRGRSESRQSSSSAGTDKKPKLIALREGMNEYSVQEYVRSLLFDSTYSEGSTRKDFVDNFKKTDKTLKDVRSFIDGMHGYILSTRGIVIGEKLLGSSNLSNSSGGSGDQTAFVFSAAAAPDSSEELTQEVLSPMDHNSAAPTVLEDLNQLDSESLAAVSFIVFTVVEEAVFLPLSDQIKKQLPSGKMQSEDEDFIAKLHELSGWSQENWGVKPDLVSPLGWQNAIFELSALEHHLTPTMHLLALSRCMNAIYSEFKLVVLPSLTARGVENVFLGADDLVPIFIYVLSKSDLRRPILYKEQMWGLCHPGQLIGESGYYLTVLESAIEFIKEVDPAMPIDVMEAPQDSSPAVERRRDDSTSSISSRSSKTKGDLDRSPAGATKKQVRPTSGAWPLSRGTQREVFE